MNKNLFDAAYIKALTRKDILALDIAKTTGYYSYYSNGIWKFPNTSEAPMYLGYNYEQMGCFTDTVCNYIQEHDIKLVVAEDVIQGKGRAWIKLANFQGCLFNACYEMGIPEPYLINPTSLKRFATGNYMASKQEMVNAAQTRWHENISDNNIADACHLYKFFCKRYDL